MKVNYFVLFCFSLGVGGGKREWRPSLRHSAHQHSKKQFQLYTDFPSRSNPRAIFFLPMAFPGLIFSKNEQGMPFFCPKSAVALLTSP